jgi:hypothetical protein
MEWDSEPLVTVFTNTLTKGDSDHVSPLNRNGGTDSKSPSRDVDRG